MKQTRRQLHRTETISQSAITIKSMLKCKHKHLASEGSIVIHPSLPDAAMSELELPEPSGRPVSLTPAKSAAVPPKVPPVPGPVPKEVAKARPASKARPIQPTPNGKAVESKSDRPKAALTTSKAPPEMLVCGLYVCGGVFVMVCLCLCLCGDVMFFALFAVVLWLCDCACVFDVACLWLCL